MKHAKKSNTHQVAGVTFLNKFITENNKKNPKVQVAIDEGTNRIRISCDRAVRHKINSDNEWNIFRNRIYFHSDKLFHVITDTELEFNYPDFCADNTFDLFTKEGVIVCYLDRPPKKGDEKLLDWLLRFCVD